MRTGFHLWKEAKPTHTSGLSGGRSGLPQKNWGALNIRRVNAWLAGQNEMSTTEQQKKQHAGNRRRERKAQRAREIMRMGGTGGNSGPECFEPSEAEN